jgi:hypothetical protein
MTNKKRRVTTLTAVPDSPVKERRDNQLNFIKKIVAKAPEPPRPEKQELQMKTK